MPWSALCGNDTGPLKEAIRRDRELPTPLPIYRERSLTPPLPSETSGSRIPTGRRDPLRITEGHYQVPQELTAAIGILQNTSDQGQSRLFMVPPELRQEIWKMSLGNNVIHILHRHQRLGNVKCKSTFRQKWGTGWHDCWISDFLRKNRRSFAPQIYSFLKDGQGYSEGLLGLIVTCRKIYSEAIDLLYGTNTFDVRDLFTIFDLSSTLLRKRFNMITSLQISWHLYTPIIYGSPADKSFVGVPCDRETWEETWKLVATMGGLKILRVDIVTWATLGEFGFEHKLKLLQAMTVVQLTDEFEVRVPWPIERAMKALSEVKIDLSFTLEGPTEDEYQAMVEE